MSEYLQAAVQRVLAGSRDEADLMAIATAIQTGQFTWTSSKGAIGVDGDIVNSLIVPGSYNIINSTIVLEREAVIAIQALLTQRLGVAPISAIAVDELLQQVRSRASTKVLSLFSQIQLLNKRQVSVDQLYVDVYVLEVRDFRATIPGLLEGQDAREQFDRFGLGTRGERSPGLAIAASEDFPRLMLLGKPGSGKSTFLRHLAVSCAKGEFLSEYIPVLLELRDVDEAAFSLFQCLHGEFGLEQEAQTEQILKQGCVLLLLDGLDEVPSSLRQTVQHELRKFAKRYDKNRFILTCRTQTTEYIPEQFQAVEVADFKPEQVECFALHWFTAMAGTSEQGMALKNQFMEKLRESPQTAELAVTPVLLSLTCWIFDDLKDLPQKRSDLYRDGLDLLLQQWDGGRGISRDSGSDRYRQLTTEERKQLLSYVAVRKFEQAENFVLYEESELCSYIAEHLQVPVEESRAVLGAIAQQHGLLIERAQGIWSFSHLTFQEYLVAKWLIECTTRLNVVNHPLERRWQEVFSLSLEMRSYPEELFLLLKEKFDADLITDEKLKNFINWVNQKSISVNSSYGQTAIRTFYFGLASALDSFRNSSFNKGIVREINNDIFRGCLEDSSLDLDRALMGLLEFMIDPYRNSNHFDYAIGLIQGNISIIGCELELRQILQELINQLSNLTNEIETELSLLTIWCVNNGQAWSDQLRELMIRNRNIGHDWGFNKEQMEVMSEHFDANVFLVGNLRKNHGISDDFRKNLLEKLFLVNV